MGERNPTVYEARGRIVHKYNKATSLERVTIVFLVVGICYSLFQFQVNFVVGKAGFIIEVFSIPVYIAICCLLYRKVYVGAGILMINAVMLGFLVTLALSNPANIQFNSVLRASVFDSAIVSKAICSLFLFNAIMALTMLWSGPRQWDFPDPTNEEISLFRLFIMPSLFCAMLLHVLTVRGPLITRAAYFSGEYIKAGAGKHDQTLQMLGTFLLVFSLASSIFVFGWRHRYSKISIFTSVFIILFFYLLRGSRGVVLGFGILFFVLILVKMKSKYKYVIVSLAAISLYLLLQIWASVRWEATSMGLWHAMKYSTRLFSERMRVDRDPLSIQRFPQMTWNLFDVVDLYESGIRRNGRTYLNLIPQAVPKPIAKALNYERPLAEPWILADYVVHGGAINPVAEAYWNFGIWGVILVAFILSRILIWLEFLFRKLPLAYTYLYFGSILLLPGSYIAGTQAFVRVVEAVLLLILVTKIVFPVVARKFNMRRALECPQVCQ